MVTPELAQTINENLASYDYDRLHSLGKSLQRRVLRVWRPLPDHLDEVARFTLGRTMEHIKAERVVVTGTFFMALTRGISELNRDISVREGQR